MVNSNSKDSVILVGASVRSLAESAVRIGITPLCVDMFADADLSNLLRKNRHPDPIQVRTFSDLANVTQRFPAEIPLIWTGGLENHPHILQRLSEQHSVCGVQAADLPNFRSRAGLRAIVAGTECHLPAVISPAVISSAAGLKEQTAQRRWLVKPIYSSGGLGIRSYKPGSKLHSLEFLQQAIAGTAASALFFHDGRNVELLGVSTQIAGEAALGGTEFCFCGCVGPVAVPPRIRAILNDVGQHIGAAGLPGVFGADFVVDGHDVWLLEVNPRITASHELYDFTGPHRTVLQRQLNLAMPAAPHQHQPPDGTPDVRGAGHASMLARLIVYLRHATVLTASDVSRLLDLGASAVHRESPGCWLADIPPSGDLAAGQPFCSIYHRLEPTASGWRPTSDESRVSGMDSIVARIAGVPMLNSASTAIHYASLFE